MITLERLCPPLEKTSREQGSSDTHAFFEVMLRYRCVAFRWQHVSDITEFGDQALNTVAGVAALYQATPSDEGPKE